MTLPQIISRNNIQKTNKRVISFTNDIVQPTTWYTCPTGKIAIVKGTCQCVSLGAAASTSLEFATVKYAGWSASGSTNTAQLDDLLTAIKIEFEVKLAAGDTIVTDQASGTNAQFKLGAEIEEFII